MERRSCTGSSRVTSSSGVACQGWMVNRTQSCPSRSTVRRSKACREEVLAPVSTLALIQGTGAVGRATHSLHPTWAEAGWVWDAPGVW